MTDRITLTTIDQAVDVLQARQPEVSKLTLELIDWISKKGIEGHTATSVYGALHLVAGLTGRMSEHSFQEALRAGIRDADLLRSPPQPKPEYVLERRPHPFFPEESEK